MAPQWQVPVRFQVVAIGSRVVRRKLLVVAGWFQGVSGRAFGGRFLVVANGSRAVPELMVSAGFGARKIGEHARRLLQVGGVGVGVRAAPHAVLFYLAKARPCVKVAALRNEKR